MIDVEGHKRRAALHQILATATMMLQSGAVDNNRAGYKQDVERMQEAIKQLKWYRPYIADDKHGEWEWSE